MHQPRDWYSSVQDNTIRKMKRLGFTPLEIAERLGRTEGSLRERADILGIPFRREAGTSGLVKSAPTDFTAEKKAEIFQRQADERFWKAVCVAIWRGDNLPAGQDKPVRPLVLTP